MTNETKPFKLHFNPSETVPHIGPTGLQLLYYFENGYGASVIPEYDGLFSIGNMRPIPGLFELAVLKHDSNPAEHWSMCYDTPVADDTIRRQSQSQIDELLERIAAL